MDIISDDEEYSVRDHWLMAHVKVVSVTAAASLGCDVDLAYLGRNLRNTVYNPYKFPALDLFIKEPTYMNVRVFKSGMVRVTGAKNEEDCRDAMEGLARAVRNIGYKFARVRNFNVRNIVATFDFCSRIDLLSLKNSKHNKFCKYNPDKFAGLIYKMMEPEMKLIIF